MVDGLGRDVDPGHPVPPRGEGEAVPAAAAGHVQDPGTADQTEALFDERDVGPGRPG
jgi:hypothetical protein